MVNTGIAGTQIHGSHTTAGNTENGYGFCILLFHKIYDLHGLK